MTPTVKLTLKNDLAELARLSEFIETFGAGAGLSAKTIFDMQLTLDEVVTNVISYAYSTPGDHEIVVRLGIDDDQVLIMQVEDDGQEFDPLSVGAPDLDAPLEEREIGGLGMHLVRRLMDTLDYRRQAGRNQLTMKRKLTLPQA